MTPIISNGSEWLFVPVPDALKGYDVTGYDIDEMDGKQKLGATTNESLVLFQGLPAGSWSIHSTISEALANEELAREIVEFSNPIDKLLGILLVNSINPTQPHIVLKKEL